LPHPTPPLRKKTRVPAACSSAQDSPLPDAVVYLTNSRTRAVKSYIIGADGTYRFPSLSSAIDYEVYAQYKDRKSDTKSVSQFDDRSEIYIVLKINTR
jgi:hypothetical protein